MDLFGNFDELKKNKDKMLAMGIFTWTIKQISHWKSGVFTLQE